jgi:hypothetical protein
MPSVFDTHLDWLREMRAIKARLLDQMESREVSFQQGGVDTTARMVEDVRAELQRLDQLILELANYRG